MPNSHPQQTEPPKALVNALRRLLRPLIKLLIEKNITFTYLSNLLKGVYVEVANQHFQPRQKPLTDSRISMLTGVHRKDVKRFRESPEMLQEPPRSLSISSKIIGHWQGHPDYLDAQNQPKALSRSEFDDLVAMVSTDIRPRTILDEWSRQQFLTIERELIRLNVSALIPSENFDEMAHFFGRNLEDHIAAAGDNLAGVTPPHLERAVFYSQLTDESVAQLEQYAKEQSIELLQQLNKRALQLVEQDREAERPDKRFRFGVYFYEEQVSGERGSP